MAPHTDYGVITLLHQDDVGGLQVATRAGEWVTAHPIPGTLVINSGDLLGRWSNDRFKSNPHRVVNSSGRERLSIAVFADPDFDTPIMPVTGQLLLRARDGHRHGRREAGRRYDPRARACHRRHRARASCELIGFEQRSGRKSAIVAAGSGSIASVRSRARGSSQ